MFEMINNIQRVFGGLQFDEESHTYWRMGNKMKPVSNVVHDFVEQFDANGNAERIAKRDGKTTEQVLAGWKEINDESIRLGNEVHQFGEDYVMTMYHGAELYNRLQVNMPQKAAIVQFFEELDNKYFPAMCELKMYNDRYKIAGTCDLIMFNAETKNFVLFDYKTNKDLYKNFKGKTMLPPFDFLLDMPINHYQVQLSLYKLIFDIGIETKIEEAFLIYLPREGGYKTIKVNDYSAIIKEHLDANTRSNSESTELIL